MQIRTYRVWNKSVEQYLSPHNRNGCRFGLTECGIKVSNSIFLHITDTGDDSGLEECGIKVSNSVFLHKTETGDDSYLESVE